MIYSTLLLALCAFTEASPLAKKDWGSWQPPVHDNSTNATTTPGSNAPHNGYGQSHGTPSPAGWGSSSPSSSNDNSDGNSDQSGWAVQYHPPESPDSIDSGAMWSAPAPAPPVLLTPSFHPDHDDTDFIHIVPQDIIHLFFGEGAPNTDIPHGSQFVSAKTSFDYPTVNIDHSAYTTATATSSGLIIDFTSAQAYYIAKNSWPATGTQFVLITTEGNEDGNSDYHLVSSVEFDDYTLSCICHSTLSEPKHVADHLDITWGTYNANQQGGAHGPGFRSGAEGLNTTSGSSSWNNGGSNNVTGASGKGGINGYNNGTYGGHCNKTSSAGYYRNSTKAEQCFACAAVGTTSFDTDLDDALGYFNWDAADFASDINSFAPGLTDTNYDDYLDNSYDADGIFDTDGSVDIDQTGASSYFQENANATRRIRARHLARAKRELARRGKTETRTEEAVSALKQTGATFAVTTSTTIETFIADAWDRIKGFFTGVKNLIKAIVAGEGDFDKTSTFSIPGPGIKYEPQTYFINKNTGAPRNALKIYSADNYQVYCVDCGVSGTMTTAGAISFSLRSGLKSATAEIRGDLSATVNVGIHFEGNIIDTKSQPLLTQGIPGISVDKLFSLGPYVTIKAGTTLILNAQANVLVGGTVTVSNAMARIDLVNENNRISPSWTPSIEPLFEIDGKITITATANLELGFALGLDIASGTGKAEAVIISQPSIGGVASYDSQPAEGDCTGVSVRFELEHELYAQARLAGFGRTYNTDKYNLIDPLKLPVVNKCIGGTVGNQKRQVSNGTTSSNGTLYADDDPVSYKLVDYPSNAQPFPNQGDNVFPSVYQFPDVIQKAFDNRTSESDYAPIGDNDPSTGSYNYTVVQDYNDNYNLAAMPNGNLGLVPIGAAYTDSGTALWQSYKNVVVGDAYGRTLFYYPDEMKAYNVSRFRVADENHIPLTSDLINLTPIQMRDGALSGNVSSIPSAILVAIDTQDNYFWTVLCDYVDSSLPSKIFLVRDPRNDIATLQSKDVENCLTGAEVSQCYFEPFLTGTAGY